MVRPLTHRPSTPAESMAEPSFKTMQRRTHLIPLRVPIENIIGCLLKLSCVGGVLHLVRCGNYLIKPRPYLKIVLSRKIRRKEKEIKISVLTVLNLRDLLFSTALIFHSASKKWGLSDLDPTARLIISF